MASLDDVRARAAAIYAEPETPTWTEALVELLGATAGPLLGRSWLLS